MPQGQGAMPNGRSFNPSALETPQRGSGLNNTAATAAAPSTGRRKRCIV
jgi:hypothetical protein